MSAGPFGDQARVRLVCLAFGDAEECAYRRWAGRMPPVEVCVLRVQQKGGAGAAATTPYELPLQQLAAWARADSEEPRTADGSRAPAWPSELGEVRPLVLCALGARGAAAAHALARDLVAGGSRPPSHVVLVGPGSAPCAPLCTATATAMTTATATATATAGKAPFGGVCGTLLVLRHRRDAGFDAGAWAAACGESCRFLHVAIQPPAPAAAAGGAGTEGGGGHDDEEEDGATAAAVAAAWLDSPPLLAVGAPSPTQYAHRYAETFEQTCRVLCSDLLCRPMHELVLLQARLTPSRPACICGAVRLSYGGFVRAAHAVAAHIVASAAAAGVPHVRGRRLVLLLPKAEVLPVAYMACNMLRCPVSTLDTRNPPAMLAYQVRPLARSCSRLVISPRASTY